MEDWPTGRIERVAPRVRRLLAPNPSPFTYTGTQTYLVGEGEVAVIDPGPRPARRMSTRSSQRRWRASGSRRSCAPTPTATTARPAARSPPRPARRSSAARRSRSRTTGPRADAAFDPDYRPDRVLADGERWIGGRLDADRGRDARPHLEPPLLRARRDRRAVHRRSRDGLVDHRRRAARRRHGRLYGKPRQAAARATTASIIRPTARRSTSRRATSAR